MTWLFVAIIITVVLFGMVVLFGAPYLPTLRAQSIEALDLLDLRPGQTLLELGSGDGRILREAAKRGIYSIGYELNPLLVVWSMYSSLKYRRYITIRWGNYWRHKLPATDGIYVFLLDKYMAKLNNKIEQDISGNVKLVSFAFAIPGKKPAKESNGLKLYHYK